MRIRHACLDTYSFPAWLAFRDVDATSHRPLRFLRYFKPSRFGCLCSLVCAVSQDRFSAPKPSCFEPELTRLIAL